MEKVTNSTTLNNYGWHTAWYVVDPRKPDAMAKHVWIRRQGIESYIETVGGWAFRDDDAAMLFEMVWIDKYFYSNIEP
jgi:hypothetical protein